MAPTHAAQEALHNFVHKVVDALHTITGYRCICWSFNLSNGSSQCVHSIAIGAAEDLDCFLSNSQRRSLRK
jgi:hypothetical protein